jgi:esterase/lipase superfamily enzyme
VSLRQSPSCRTARVLLASLGFIIALSCNKAPAPVSESSNQASMTAPPAAKPSSSAKPSQSQTNPDTTSTTHSDLEPSRPSHKVRSPRRSREIPDSHEATEADRATVAPPPPPPPPPPEPSPIPREQPSPAAAANSAADGGFTNPSAIPKTDRSIVRVFYATDREETANSKPQSFGPNESPTGQISYGIAEVSIPPDHRMGNLEEPILDVKVLYNPAKYVTVLSSDETDKNTFFTRLKSQVSSSPRKEALIFIHGFNVGFGPALRRTAQLSYDLQFPGATICYSWPSRGSMFAYTADEDSVQWTAMHLLNFLQAVYEKSGATSIDIIAHSMGNRALLSALQLLGTSPAPQFDQVVLAAPDVASSLFTQLIPTVQKHARRITLYASSKDQALLASARVNHYRRAGDSRGTLTIIPPVETIDASTVDTGFLGHSYFGDNNSVLSDLYYLLKDGFPASQRARLETKTIPAGIYWAFRP